jgi:hypothetical protein
MVELDVHLHQRLLHSLDVRRRLIDEALPVPKKGTQPDYPLPWSETTS